MSAICRECGVICEPKEWQRRNHEWRCWPCTRAAQKVNLRRHRHGKSKRRVQINADAPFFERYAARIMPVTESGCWIWMGSVSHLGYGKLRRPRERTIRFAHRESWVDVHGNIPAGLAICHHCDVPSCVNPDHLFVGTQLDNMRDMTRKGRRASKLTAEQVHEIRSSPLNAKALAVMMGLAHSTVWAARAGKTFSSL